MAKTPALPRQCFQGSLSKNMYVRRRYRGIKPARRNRQANDSFVESTLVMATLFQLRTVVARSELLLLCMYGARVRDF